MRLQLLLLATSFSLATVSTAQSITFDKSNYDPGDAVVASLSPTAGKTIIGYGDDIDQSSHQPPADPQNIGLGTISAPGLYAVSFSFSDGSVEVYNFLIFDAGGNTDPAGSVLFVHSPIASAGDFSTFYSKFTAALNTLDWGSILSETGKEYLVNNAVNASFAVVVCVGSAAQPELFTFCATELKNNGAELAVILTKQIAIEMSKKGIIDDNLKDLIVSGIAGARAIISIQTLRHLDKRDWDHLFDAVAKSADVVLGDGSAANILVQQNQQIFSQTRLLMQFHPN